MKHSEIKKRQLEIVSKYYKIENNSASVELYYNTFAELIDNNLGNDKVEKLNSTIFSQLEESFLLLPKKCDINLKVYIKDFGTYKEEEAEKIIKDNIGLKVYALMIENIRKHRTNLLLMGGGVLVLLFSYFLGKTSTPSIITEIINISGTLLIWESVSDYIIERSVNRKIAKQYIKKLKNIDVIKNDKA